VRLREVRDSDLPVFFANHSDPATVEMSAFPARDRPEFDAHWARIRADPSMTLRTIEVDGEVAGDIGSWWEGGVLLVGYVVGPEYWGRGIATRALGAFLEIVRERPIRAWVAAHNAGSLRVLEKNGFREIARSTHPDGVVEVTMELAAP
jgi:RimJ/RimL family protein N-acetyltransferase